MARFNRTQPHKPLVGYPINGVGYLFFTSKLLKEDGFAILQESGGFILLEQIFTPPTTGIQSFNGVTYANTKTVNGVVLTNVKTWNGIA